MFYFLYEVFKISMSKYCALKFVVTFHVLHISSSAFKVRLVERCLLSADTMSGAQPSMLGS